MLTLHAPKQHHKDNFTPDKKECLSVKWHSFFLWSADISGW